MSVFQSGSACAAQEWNICRPTVLNTNEVGPQGKIICYFTCIQAKYSGGPHYWETRPLLTSSRIDIELLRYLVSIFIVYSISFLLIISLL